MIVPMLVIALYTMVIDGIFSHRRRVTGASWSEAYRIQGRLWELNCGILGLWLSEGAAFVITGTLKNLCGKPRPDIISRCQPVEGSADAPVFGLSTRDICTNTDEAIMADGFRSFPSGHSSGAFAGLFFLSLYLAGKLHVLDNRGEVWRTVIVLIPTLAAACVAVSRIMDARHHPFDVLFGSALGMLVAWGSYRQYFPPLSETWKKGRAYPIRTWGTRTKAPPPPSASPDPGMVHKDRDMELYRTPIPGSDDYLPPQSDPPGFSQNPNTRDTEYRGRGGRSSNVFRDQISQSQRQRQSSARIDGIVSTDGHNPYAPSRTMNGAEYTSPRQRDHDEEGSIESVSEGDNFNKNGRHVSRPANAESFEMHSPQPRSHMSPTFVGGPRSAASPPTPPLHHNDMSTT